MGSIADLTLGQLVAAAARYRPVAVTVALILLVLVVLPRPERAAETAATEFAPTTRSGAPAVTATTTPPADGAAAGAGTGAVLSPPSPVGDGAFDSGRPSSEPSRGAPEPGSFASGDAGSLDNASPSTTVPSGPLRVVARAWASRTAGTPLAAEGVPAGSLPVGTRLGQDDKLSFVRLEGSERTLRLAENAQGARSTAGPAAVRACQVRDPAWTEGDAMDFEDAPDYDPGACVEGRRAADGTWSFDLGGFASPTDQRGVALVPGEEAGLDFQVAFRPA